MTGTAPAPFAYGQASISFGFPLTAAPTTHFVEKDGAAVPECPGAAVAPAAAAGHLCSDESQRFDVDGFNDPITGESGVTSRVFGVLVDARSDAAGDF